jgi:hypothetical protein
MTNSSIAVARDAQVAALRAARPDARIFEVGGPSSRVVACVGGGHCEIHYFGESTPAEKIELFSEIKAAGCAVETLMIDFSHFTGVIDWSYSKRQTNTAPGIEPPPVKVAYVASDPMAKRFAKAILLYSQQTWQVFTNADEAKAWLGWP